MSGPKVLQIFCYAHFLSFENRELKDPKNCLCDFNLKSHQVIWSRLQIHFHDADYIAACLRECHSPDSHTDLKGSECDRIHFLKSWHCTMMNDYNFFFLFIETKFIYKQHKFLFCFYDINKLQKEESRILSQTEHRTDTYLKKKEKKVKQCEKNLKLIFVLMNDIW
jgi:hypothetical protein